MATELAEGNGAAAEGQPNAGALVTVATPNVPVHEGTRNPQVTRPGRARFAIFMDRDTKEPCNWDHKKKQDDAWLLRLARNRGHVREPSAALLIEFEADPLARAAWRQSKWAALSDNAKKPNWRQVVEFWAWVECYAQQYHPGSKFNLMLQQWKLGAGEFNEPLDLYILWAMEQTLRREKGKLDSEGVVPGMGVGAPTVKKLNIAVNKIHKMFGLVSPAHDDEYQEHCTVQLNLHTKGDATTLAKEVHHCGFDAYEDLPKLFHACSTMPGWSPVKRQQSRRARSRTRTVRRTSRRSRRTTCASRSSGG